MSDGAHPCGERSCDHDLASHFVGDEKQSYDGTTWRHTRETGGCLCRGCDCVKYTPKEWPR